MVQQQLLLILLLMFGGGNSAPVGITMFPDNQLTACRNALSSDLLSLAARAHQYYHRPIALGGGGNSFIGLWADATSMARLANLPDCRNANGVYIISSAGTSTRVTIQGLGPAPLRTDMSYTTMRIEVREPGPDSLYQVY